MFEKLKNKKEKELADMYFTYKVFRLDFQSGLLHRRTGVYPQFDCVGESGAAASIA